MDRPSKACLSRHELSVLQQLSFDPRHPVLDAHRQLLLSMKLIKHDAGRLSLTGEGRQRLKREQPTNWTPVYRPWGLPTKA
jgi:hypothetical protein